MIQAGTPIVANNLRIVSSFIGKDPFYTRTTVRGKVVARDKVEGERPPTRDQTGCYWVEIPGGTRYLVHESHLAIEEAAVTKREVLA